MRHGTRREVGLARLRLQEPLAYQAREDVVRQHTQRLHQLLLPKPETGSWQ